MNNKLIISIAAAIISPIAFCLLLIICFNNMHVARDIYLSNPVGFIFTCSFVSLWSYSLVYFTW